MAFFTEEPYFFGADLARVVDVQVLAPVWKLGRRTTPWFRNLNEAIIFVFGYRDQGSPINAEVQRLWKESVSKWISLDRHYSWDQIQHYALLTADLPARGLTADELELRAQHGVLAHNPGKNKSDVPAVIFEPRTGREAFGLRDQGIADIYAHHQDVYTAYTGSVEELCDELRKARKIFGRPLGLVKLAGHGHATSMDLGGESIWFEGTLTTHTILPEGIIDETIAKDAIIILRSCSTGAVMEEARNLAQQFSKWAPGRTIVAPCTDTTPDALTYTIRDGKPVAKFYYTNGSKGDHTFLIKPRPRSFWHFVLSLFRDD